MRINKYGLKIVGLKKAASITHDSDCWENSCVEIFYDRSTGEVWGDLHITNNEWSEYHDSNIIRVCVTRGKMSMQEIADEISKEFIRRNEVKSGKRMPWEYDDFQELIPQKIETPVYPKNTILEATEDIKINNAFPNIIPSGTKGRVICEGDMGQFFVKWKNGIESEIFPGEDAVKVVKVVKTIKSPKHDDYSR